MQIKYIILQSTHGRLVQYGKNNCNFRNIVSHSFTCAKPISMQPPLNNIICNLGATSTWKYPALQSRCVILNLFKFYNFIAYNLQSPTEKKLVEVRVMWLRSTGSRTVSPNPSVRKAMVKGYCMHAQWQRVPSCWKMISLRSKGSNCGIEN